MGVEPGQNGHQVTDAEPELAKQAEPVNWNTSADSWMSGPVRIAYTTRVGDRLLALINNRQ